jgi:hypothetical protein
MSYHCRLLLVACISVLAFIALACDKRSAPQDNSELPDGDVENGDLDYGLADGDEDQETDNSENELPDSWGDVMAYARLDANATLTEVFPWPREAEVAIATVRDGREETNWSAQTTEVVPTVTLDLWPIAIRMPKLRKLVVDQLDGAALISAHLFAFCGDTQPMDEITLDNNGVASLSDQRAGCVEIQLMSNAADIHVGRIELEANLSDFVAFPFPDQSALAIERTPNTGVIEGFYGVPWSWQERKRMMLLMAQNGMDTFIYAPKWDPYHRDDWRHPYAETELAKFQDIAATADPLSVRFMMGLSPFVDFDEETDYPILRDKIIGFLELGINGVMLLADDIEEALEQPIDGTLGHMHAEMVNRLYDDMRDVDPNAVLWFTPTVYSDERTANFDDGPAYLTALRDLAPDIEILWTGSKTSGATMTAQEMESVTGYIGRKPLIWDNFWANDGGDGFTGRLMLAPFSGRGADLPSAVSGIMHNPSIQGAITRITMSTFADYLNAPAAYSPTEAPSSSVQRELAWRVGTESNPEKDANLVRWLMRIWNGHANKEIAYDEMDADINTFISTLDRAPDDALLSTLLIGFGRMAAVRSELHHSGLAADILDELDFPSQAIRYTGELGLQSLLLWQAKRMGTDTGAIEAAAEQAASKIASCRFVFSAGTVVDLQKAVQKWQQPTEGDASAVPPVLPDLSTSACIASEPLTINIANPIQIFGLGAPQSYNGNSATLTAPHPGLYQSMVIATAPGGPVSGFAFSTQKLICAPKLD